MTVSVFYSLSELQQDAIRAKLGSTFAAEDDYEKAAADKDFVKRAVAEFIKSHGHYTEDSPFMQLSRMERQAIAYYLRRKDVGRMDEAKYNEMALDKNLMNQIVQEYKIYAGIKD